MAVVGIDPGLKGAMALVVDDGTLTEVYDLPVLQVRHKKSVRAELNAVMVHEAMQEWAEFNRVTKVVIEEVHAFSKQGIASAFRFGQAHGMLIALAAVVFADAEQVRVPPHTWKKALKLGSDKELSRTKATQLWPREAARFARKLDVDRAEAALLAYWGTGAWK